MQRKRWNGARVFDPQRARQAGRDREGQTRPDVRTCCGSQSRGPNVWASTARVTAMPSAFNINAKTLALCEDLDLLARTIVEGFFDGLHRSPFLGYSTEFSAYRQYTQGDDLRRIDWK